MRKTTSTILIIVNAILLTACSGKSGSTAQNGANKTENISQVQSNIDSNVYALTKKDYDNLDLSEVKVDFPEITEYHNLRLSSSNELTIDERIEYIKQMIKKFFPEHTYSDEYLIWWGQLSGVETEIYPNVIKYKDKVADSLSTGSFIYESDGEARHEHDAYLLLEPHTLVGTMKKGTGRDITEDKNEEHRLAGWFPVDCYEKVERYDIDSLPDISYKLYDKEVSLSDAVNYAIEFFDNDYLSVLPDFPIKPKISAIEVRKYNDIYGYRFLLKNYYEGIPFDDNFDLGYISKMSDGKDYQNFTNEAFMAKSNDIDFWYMQQFYSKVEYDGDAVTNIVPLDEALSITSDKLTKSVVFEVNKVDFVYCPLVFEKDSSETTAEAAWKISAFNSNDNCTYIVYVNATNGELRYYAKN